MSTFLFWRRINHQTARYVTLRLMPDFLHQLWVCQRDKNNEMETESKPTPVSVSRKERSSIDTCQWLEGHSESGQGELSEEGWLHSADCCCLSDRQSALKKLRYVLRKQDNIVFGFFFSALCTAIVCWSSFLICAQLNTYSTMHMPLLLHHPLMWNSLFAASVINIARAGVNTRRRNNTDAGSNIYYNGTNCSSEIINIHYMCFYKTTFLWNNTSW